MKRLFAVLLVLLVTLCFASCDGGTAETTDTDVTAFAQNTTVFLPTDTAEPVDTTVPETTDVATAETTAPVEISTGAQTTAEPDVTDTPDDTTVTDVTTEVPVETTVPEEFDYVTSDLGEYIALGKYLGIEVIVAPIATITDAQIEDELKTLADSLPEEAMITEGACQMGDKVNIDYVGTVDGAVFEGGNAAGQTATLGAGEYVEGFEEGIVGMSVGEIRDISVVFPDYYYSDLAGKEATFTVTLNYIYPALTDEIVAEYLGYTDLAELKAEIRVKLETAAAQEVENERAEAAWTKAMANSHIIGYPEAAVGEAFGEQVELYRSSAESYGMTYEQFIEQGYGISVEEAEGIFMEYAKNSVAQQLLLYAIARDMGMDVSDAAYEDELLALAESLGLASASELAEVTGYSKAYLKEMLIYSEVLDAIVKQANFVENISN